MDERKLLARALAHPESLRFAEALALANALGFRGARVRGSHHILSHAGIPELINLQDVGGMAKPYQVRQILDLAERYNLRLGGDA